MTGRSVHRSLGLAQLVMYECEVNRGPGNIGTSGTVASDFDISSRLDDDGDLLYSITATHDFTDQAGDLVAHIAVTYLSVYVVHDDLKLTDDEIQEFGRASAIPHVVPFVREFLSTMTNRLALPPYLLPIVRQPIRFEDDDTRSRALSTGIAE